ncbi:unnamed protein product [Caenorhabditis angaria]|uniref:Small ribosomal subunit protein mS23 n=1 Tax=Caenorhabditis angaria TaxID=860376 RepID=A0A9P1N2M9_9PELO|nr:unnamed protein product [Caenorhabditis angaria]
MAQFVARTERSGNIFSRVTGLIRAGQLSWSDRPLWYDVYVSSPPLSPPDWNVKLAKHGEPIRPIFYEEDVLRAKFYKKYRNTAAIQIDSSKQSISQQFLNEYQIIKNENPTEENKEEEEIFEKTEKRLQENGITLK